MDIHVKTVSSISIFYLCILVFKHDFIRCIDFTHIAASNTASDNVKKQVTYRIFNTNLLYYCAYFVVEIDEKSSHNDEYQYDSMMISE